MTVWVLGDQLSTNCGPIEHADHVLMIEAHAFGDRHRYHPQKLLTVFAAMRSFRDRLRESDYEVTYLRAETFGAALDRYFEASPGDDLVIMEPPSHGAGDRLEAMVEARGGTLTRVENELFLTTPAEFDAWAGKHTDDRTYRQENWYRHVRRETGILMDDGEPIGGEWNYDDENRETPPKDWEPPAVLRFEQDETTREVRSFVADRYPDAWGRLPDPDEPIPWPVTREQALEALEWFIDTRLGEFGPYQDAMVTDEWALSHSLLSSAINLGLLTPMEVVDRVEAAYHTGDAPLNSVEGFIRQVIGWREFMRHVYRRSMPELAAANQLEQSRELPPAYWTGETDMQCLSEAVGGVYDRGYAHHIERLMVLSNFALLYGVDPAELNEWFHLGFVDAYHWVTTPNVIGMGSFATDVLSSKPYASSGNYINRMSDHCKSCPYAVSKTTGENACPFNALYWDFLKENEATLRGTGRMGLMYSHVDNKSDEEWDAIRDRADWVRQLTVRGEL
ncbi:cryptochrome/photolyase family protein [Halalkalirubrum salinum]|uniref:cryptochrome/photolyase family protein n=1 Tax=Halalkalirubrum salinum TaxID=2563889 RepID=UPI0010FB68FA|nr:cryptochrome/photolyase family protein [Halalkalirubrum salinum]